VHGHAAGVIAPVLEPLEALNEDGNDVSGRDGADDATHGGAPERMNGGMLDTAPKNIRSIFNKKCFLISYLYDYEI
jgi:hypothetical protein